MIMTITNAGSLESAVLVIAMFLTAMVGLTAVLAMVMPDRKEIKTSPLSPYLD